MLRDVEIAKKGEIEYTKRAFQQDAQQAMGGKFERALVELITNADDSYAGLERADGYPVKGRILIEIERRRGEKNSKVIVRDMAEGMDMSELEKKLTELGVRASGFEKGQDKRGLLGRGAKDVVAFGVTTWESIKNDYYSGLRLFPNGVWELFKAKKAAAETRERLKVDKGSGTVVTIEVDNNICTIPNHKKLLEKLPSYHSLRDIMSDPSRKVLLQDLLDDSHKIDHLKYSYPKGESKLDKAEFTVPGFPSARATLTVFYRPQRFNEDKHSPYRQGGVLVKSSRAIHEITMFDFETDPYGEFFFGKLECPFIDQLIREFDERLERGEPVSSNNPRRLITRTREGLEEDHPFRKALWDAASALLQPLIDSLKEKERAREKHVENEETRQKLSKLASAASKFLVEKIKELEETVETEKQLIGMLKENLLVIPPQCKIDAGVKKTFSVRARNLVFDGKKPTVELSVSGQGFQMLSEGSKVELFPHPKYEDESVGQIRLHAMKIGGQGTLTVVHEEYTAVAKFEIVEEVPKEAPKSLCFEHKDYRIIYNKEKVVRILSPRDLVNQEGYIVRVYCDNPEIVLKNQLVELRMDEYLGYAVGSLNVVGRQLDARATLRTTLGTQTSIARVHVAQEGRGLPVRFEIRPEDYGPQRAIWDLQDKFLLKIAAKHSALKRYLGRADENFPGQAHPQCKAVIAEIIAEKIAEWILKLEEEKKGRDKDMDMDYFYSKHQRVLTEFLPVAHEIMMPTIQN